MEIKKNPNADLNRKTGLFFAIGLAFATGLSLFAINYKSEIKKLNIADVVADATIEEEVEEVHLENTPPPPPPPPPAVEIPEVIEIVDNKVEVKDDIKSSEITKNDVVEDAPKLEKVPENEEIVEDLPFAVIEEKPMFEACKGIPKGKAQDDCFKSNLDKHVQKNFRYPEMAQEMGIEGRVTVMFKIKKDGKIEVTGVRGPDKMLEAEARRIIEKLPDLIPGKQRNKAVAVTYAYPIMFKLAK